MIVRPGRTAVAALLLLSATACSDGDSPNRDTMDTAPGAESETDPALMSALRDQIMVDPNLDGQANADSIRPADQPYAQPVPAEGVAANSTPVDDGELRSAPEPKAGATCRDCSVARESMTLGALAQRQAGNAGGCAADLDYSARWATRLPEAIPLYPRARVREAAGSDKGECRLRVVSFSAPMPMQHMIDWYYTRATRAGYTAEHQADGDEHVLGGTRGSDDGAYVLFLSPRPDGGTDIDLVANNGV